MFKNKRLFQKYSYFFKYKKVRKVFDKWLFIERKKKKTHNCFFLINRSSILECGSRKFSATWNKYVFFFNPLDTNVSMYHYNYEKSKYSILFSIQKYLYIKLKFYGKTFKWLFFKRKLRFKVQKAHRTYILFKNCLIKKKRKLKLKFRIRRKSDKIKFIREIEDIKKINIFTKRGFRVLKTKLYKKQGKVSTYV